MIDNNKSEPLIGTRPEDRPLTDAERTLLQWLMAHGGPEAQQYAPHVSRVRVVAGCTCGCPTIDLAIGGRQHRTVGASLVLADFEGVTPEGIEVGVILHAREGQLSELEVYAMPEVDGPFSLPTIESLR
jgi:hypothetical protein